MYHCWIDIAHYHDIHIAPKHLSPQIFQQYDLEYTVNMYGNIIYLMVTINMYGNVIYLKVNLLMDELIRWHISHANINSRVPDHRILTAEVLAENANLYLCFNIQQQQQQIYFLLPLHEINASGNLHCPMHAYFVTNSSFYYIVFHFNV